MTEVSFYHLMKLPLSEALPRLMVTIYDRGMKVVIKVGSQDCLNELDQAIWTQNKDSFLPHGRAKDSFPDQQPIYLTLGDENPAAASVLMLVDKATSDQFDQYDRVLEMFDGRDEQAVTAARACWKQYSAAGHDLTYWQQTDQGGWTKKG